MANNQSSLVELFFSRLLQMPSLRQTRQIGQGPTLLLQAAMCPTGRFRVPRRFCNGFSIQDPAARDPANQRLCSQRPSDAYYFRFLPRGSPASLFHSRPFWRVGSPCSSRSSFRVSASRVRAPGHKQSTLCAPVSLRRLPRWTQCRGCAVSGVRTKARVRTKAHAALLRSEDGRRSWCIRTNSEFHCGAKLLCIFAKLSRLETPT